MILKLTPALALLSNTLATTPTSGNCSCTHFNKPVIEAGPIWPAYGHIMWNSDPPASPTDYVIIPPADCTDTNCWRANVTCSFNAKEIPGFSPNDQYSVSWDWFWLPTVQYPLGNKDFWSQNQLAADGVPMKLPTLEQIQTDVGAEAAGHWKTPLDTICPTNYTNSVKFCPITSTQKIQVEAAEETVYTTELIIYNYLNEQDDGKYFCQPKITKVGSSNRNRFAGRENRVTHEKLECCEATVYYASPKWNGLCWFGMFYTIGGGSLMLYFLVGWISGSKHKTI